MQSRSFMILVTAVLAMAALLYWQSSNDVPADHEQPILPGLAAVLNDVVRVTITGAGNEVIATLERGDEQWTVTERDGYSADVGRLRTSLIALAEANIVEQKTADPTLHSRLGVEDLADPTASGREFAIETPTESFRLIVGNTGVRGGMAYARQPDSDRSYLISADLDPGNETTDWLRTELLDIPAARIVSVTITHADGEVLRVKKPTPDAAEFSVVDIPEGRELQYATILNPLTGVLTGLSLEDVARDAGAAGDEAPTTASFETLDGLVIVATVIEFDDGKRVVFSVEADESNEEAQRLRAELRARLDGWAYTLPSFKTDQLTRRMDDLLTPAN